MYESFFAFKEKPFSLTPNTRFLFLSRSHNEVYAHLIYGIESRVGFIEVTGEVGTGKTTILRTLLARLDEKKCRFAFIFNPKLTSIELLRNINREFGIADIGSSSQELIQALNEFLLKENSDGRTPVLVIDEAQNLSGEVLEQIRLLSNLETEQDKLIQVVMVGQPELRQHLSDHSLRQLNQRIAVRYHLRPLNREETAAYILHRMTVAGRPDGNVFSRAALRKIFQNSGGVPRRINLICDRALLTAFTEERGVVTRRDVAQAVAELAGTGEGRRNSSHLSWPVFSVSVLLLILVGVFLWPTTFDHQPVPEDAPRKVNSVTPIASSQKSSISLPLETVQPDSLISSCNAILALWGVPPLDDRQPTAGLDIELEFNDRGLELVRLAGSFEDFSRFNVPLLLPLSEEQGGGYLAVLALAPSGLWSVAPAFQGRDQMPPEELDKLDIQMAFIPWIDFANIGYVKVPGMKGDNVRKLQFLLGLTECPKIRTNSRYDASSINCVKEFQRKHGLIVDGLVGPRTLIQLYQAAGAYKMPRLFD
jgi:general secretion pathway protein A